MHSELPWNVAGIPPEAREAARAAARREGLSVGEWMTRRIIRGFPGTSIEENSNWRTPVEAPPAPIAEPAPSTSARDTEEMLACVSRSESESQNAYKAIDQQMKTVSRRLEDAERNQTENSRAMTQAATQINIAAREQAQAFEQMSTDVTALTERLIRVERHAANDGMRDAVKALHQGLSRVADQIASTASQSAEQIAALAGNMDSLATQVVEARERTEATAQAVETHFTSLDERLRVVERTAFSSASAIDHTMENVENLKASSDTIESETRRHGAAIAQMKDVFDHLNARIAAAEQQDSAIEHLQASISNIEASVSTVEASVSAVRASVSTVETSISNVEAFVSNVEASVSTVEASVSAVKASVSEVEASVARTDETIADLRAQDSTAPLDHRLQGIEHVLSDIMSRLEYSERNSASQTGTVEQTLRELSAGFEAADRRNRETINELQLALQQAAVKISAVEEKAAAPVPPHSAAPEPAAAPAEPAQPIFDAPPFAEHLASPESDTSDFATPFAAEHDDIHDDLPPAFGEPFAEAVPPFADEPMPGEPESFLAAARRSAQAAASHTEQPAPRASMGGFAWTLSGKNAAKGDTERKRLVVGGSIFGVAVAAALTGVVLTRGVGAPQPEAKSPPTSVSSPLAAPPSLAPSAQETSGNTQPQAAIGDDQSTPASNPQTAATQQPAPAPQSTAATEPKPRHSHAAAAAQVAAPQTAAAQAPAPLQKLASLANTGDSRSQLLLGMKYLEGSGTAVNEAEAARWLSRSAQQGEPMAQYRLGTLYERGRGVAADPRQASHWYELAAKQGNRKAMHNLAVAFAEGSGEPKDSVSSAMWFSRAANLGLADSQFNLAVLYERGMGVKQSLVDAYKWYLIAAAQGDAESKTRADALGTQLNDADRAAAQQAATAFRPERPNPAANSVPVLG
jgi:localization factor PodJL